MPSHPERREAILDRSAELFAAKGIAATTVREIGEAAGVFPGSLYHWFGSKDGLVRTILTEFMTAVQQRFDAIECQTPDPVAQVCGYIAATLDVIDAYPLATAIYQHDRGYLRDHGLLDAVDVPARAVRGHWLQAIESGVAAGSFRDDVPAELFYRSVRDTLWSTTHWPARDQYRTQEFAAIMVSLFMTGFATQPFPMADAAERASKRT